MNGRGLGQHHMDNETLQGMICILVHFFVFYWPDCNVKSNLYLDGCLSASTIWFSSCL